MSTLQMDTKGVFQVCVACGQKNRTAFERLGEIGQCGRCKVEIDPPAAPVEVSSEVGFNRLLEMSPIPLLIDFWASWCGPCIQLAPELEKVAIGSAGKFLVVKVNTETLPALSERYQVRSIPTLSVIIAGREVKRTMGAQSASAIETFLREAVRK